MCTKVAMVEWGPGGAIKTALLMLVVEVPGDTTEAALVVVGDAFGSSSLFAYLIRGASESVTISSWILRFWIPCKETSRNHVQSILVEDPALLLLNHA